MGNLGQRLLDRAVPALAVLLALVVVGFFAYYILDQQSSSSTSQEALQMQLDQYEQVVRDDPENITNRLALADAYLILQRYDDAITQYEAALAINDQSTLAHVGLGRAKLGAGDLEGAAESLQVVIDQSKEADISGELVESAYYYLGSVALQQLDTETAIEHLKAATGIEPSDSDAWYLLGKAYMQTGQLDEAIDALKQAVLFVPDFAEAYEELALAYDQQGANAEAFYARGMAAYGEGNLDGAVEQLESALRASPSLVEAHAGLGLVLEMLGERDAAIDAYRQALHLNPSNFNARNGLARLSQAESAASEGAELPADHPSTQADEDSQGATP